MGIKSRIKSIANKVKSKVTRKKTSSTQQFQTKAPVQTIRPVQTKRSSSSSGGGGITVSSSVTSASSSGSRGGGGGSVGIPVQTLASGQVRTSTGATISQSRAETILRQQAQQQSEIRQSRQQAQPTEARAVEEQKARDRKAVEQQVIRQQLSQERQQAQLQQSQRRFAMKEDVEFDQEQRRDRQTSQGILFLKDSELQQDQTPSDSLEVESVEAKEGKRILLEVGELIKTEKLGGFSLSGGQRRGIVETLRDKSSKLDRALVISSTGIGKFDKFINPPLTPEQEKLIKAQNIVGSVLLSITPVGAGISASKSLSNVRFGRFSKVRRGNIPFINFKGTQFPVSKTISVSEITGKSKSLNIELESATKILAVQGRESASISKGIGQSFKETPRVPFGINPIKVRVAQGEKNIRTFEGSISRETKLTKDISFIRTNFGAIGRVGKDEDTTTRLFGKGVGFKVGDKFLGIFSARNEAGNILSRGTLNIKLLKKGDTFQFSKFTPKLKREKGLIEFRPAKTESLVRFTSKQPKQQSRVLKQIIQPQGFKQKIILDLNSRSATDIALANVKGKGKTLTQTITPPKQTDVFISPSPSILPIAKISKTASVISSPKLSPVKSASLIVSLTTGFPKTSAKTSSSQIFNQISTNRFPEPPKSSLANLSGGKISLSTGQAQGLSQGLIQTSTGRQGQGSRQGKALSQSSAQIQTASAKQITIQTPTSAQRIREITKLVPLLKTPFTTTNTIIPTPTPTPFGFLELPKFQPTKTRRTTKGKFGVQVRRRGEFRTIGKGLSLNKAFQLGRSRVGTTLGATFKITSPSGKGLSTDIGTPKGFKRKKGGLFIEQKELRLSTGGEVKEIQTARLKI